MQTNIMLEVSGWCSRVAQIVGMWAWHAEKVEEERENGREGERERDIERNRERKRDRERDRER